jgi:hypothetical protein
LVYFSGFGIKYEENSVNPGFHPLGDCQLRAVFFKYKSDQNILASFTRGESYECINFHQKMGWATLWATLWATH